MILVAGESLMDMIPEPGKELVVRACPGGSPYNVALALGRLGAPVRFLARLSRDHYGEVLRQTLEQSRVDASLCPQTDALSMLAIVDKSGPGGSARYAFYLEGTAGCALQESDLPAALPEGIQAMHFGSFGLAVEPISTAMEALCGRGKPKPLISIDPNVRPFLIRDRAYFDRRITRFLGLADLIKMSEEDMEFLHPGLTAEKCCGHYLERGASLVAVTRGEKGALLMNGRSQVHCPGEPAEVVDTVGAGDTFQAALIAWLHRSNRLKAEELEEMDAADMKEMGSYAARAAAVTCSRAGCNPPWDHELART